MHSFTHRNEVESQKVGKSSFAYAWVLDETGEERTRLVVIEKRVYIHSCVYWVCMHISQSIYTTRPNIHCVVGITG